mgnify:CR=1 FL=1
MNRIVNIYYPQRKEWFECPHYIITKIVNITKKSIDAKECRMKEEATKILTNKNKVAHSGKDDYFSKSKSTLHQELLNTLADMKEKIERLEAQIQYFKPTDK